MEEYLQIHKRAFVFDAHCDTVLSILDGRGSLKNGIKNGHIDIEKLKTGGIKAQVFSVFVRPEWYANPVLHTLKAISVLKKEFEENRDEIELANSYKDILRINKEGKISALLSIEGGEAIAGEIDMLRIYRELGVTSMILTWNNRNQIADGAGERRSKGGLSDFGYEVVKQMERLGMVVDLSHISPEGFWDVISIVKKPVIVSHSIPRRMRDIPRNLDDEQIKAIAEKDGVIGAGFYFSSYKGVQARLEDVLDEIEYFVKIGGVDHVGIGSDFDGIDVPVIGLEDASKMPEITKGLIKRGFKESEILKILGENFLRVFKEVQEQGGV